MVVRQVLVVLVALLLAFPAWANPKVVGTATSSDSARVRGVALVPGTTILSGDVIEVGPAGSAEFNLGDGAQLYVAPNSQVRVVEQSGRVQVDLARGAASLRMTEKSIVVGRLGNATIRPAGSEPAVAAVVMRGPNAALIAAQKGRLLVHTATDSKLVALNEGEGVEVALAPAPQGEDDDDRLSGKMLVILGVIVVSAATIVAAVLNQNQRDLTDQQKRDAVSPFKFP